MSDQELLGHALYVPGDPESKEAHIVCVSCHDEVPDGMESAAVHEQPAFGREVPYPECYECGEVIRP